VNETQLVEACLNGYREPHCQTCLAAPIRGGKCCFGHRHVPGDEECEACALAEECAPLTHGVSKNDARYYPRPVYPTQQPASRPVPIRTSIPPGTATVQRVVQTVDRRTIPGPLLAQQPIHPEPLQLDPEDGMFVRFLKVTTWGAGEGFFEMALNFFRKRRPE
jgi:hypothetical protein